MTTSIPVGRRVSIGTNLRLADGVVRAANSGVTDHGALTGLADDDHPQYLTQAEADALYVPLGGGTGGTIFDPTTTFFAKDDFVAAGFSSEQTGELGWGFNTGNVSGPTPIAGHPGIVQRDTAGANQTYMWLYNAQDVVVPSDTFDNTWIILPLIADGDTTLRFGFFAALANPPTDGIYIEKLTTDTDWFGVCRSGAVETRTASLGAVSTTVWARLRLRRVNGTTIGFSINGGTELTVTTNVPTAALTIVGQIGSAAVGAHELNVDYWSLLITGLSR